MDSTALHLALLADSLLAQAAESPQGRAAQKIDLDHQQLRMTAIGFIEGGELPDHKNPGEAVLQVVRGRIRLTDVTRSIEVPEGTLARIPNGVHSVTALEPSVIVLTAITLSL
jgi:quercetin dioxygenase-like cupin family protein